MTHPYDPRPGDTWCRECNSAPGEPPHADLDPADYQRCAGGCGDMLETATAFTFDDRPGYWCESCYLDTRHGRNMT